MPIDIELEGETDVQELPAAEGDGYEILVTAEGIGTITLSRYICQTVAPQLIEQCTKQVKMPDGRLLYTIGRLRITIESV